MFTNYIINLGVPIICGSMLGYALIVTYKYVTRGYQTGQIGYKKLADDYIAKLQILDENNENRKTCKYKMFAKHRCKRALVLDIYHYQDEKNKSVTGFSIHDPTFDYNVGHIVQVNNYDTDYEEVCSSGVHYFLTEECAKYYDLDPISMDRKYYTGPYKKWDDDGTLLRDCYYKKGQLNGKGKNYARSNGHLIECFNYKNGQLNGEYKNFDGNGNLIAEYNFKNGYKNGEYKKYHNNKLIKHCLYKDGDIVTDYL